MVRNLNNMFTQEQIDGYERRAEICCPRCKGINNGEMCPPCALHLVQLEKDLEFIKQANQSNNENP
jgi:hypothetical protein